MDGRPPCAAESSQTEPHPPVAGPGPSGARPGDALGGSGRGRVERPLPRFPAATVLVSPAVAGAGGVAIILPHGIEVIGQAEVVPGYATEARVRIKGRSARMLSVYLPPGHRDGTLERLAGGIGSSGVPTYVAGGLNVQMHDPRDGELRAVEGLRNLFADHGVAAVEFQGSTRKPSAEGSGEPQQLDVAAIPHAEAWRWRASANWAPLLSDHAAIVVRPATTGATRQRGMTPATMRALPIGRRSSTSARGT